MMQRLHADAITLRYDDRVIVENLSIIIPDASFTVIVGPNACGKSTLLRALSPLLAPVSGKVVLDGRNISHLPAKEVARRLGLLPQTSVAPDGITVADLVSRGRYPHQSFLRQWSVEDEEAVARALKSPVFPTSPTVQSTNFPAASVSASGLLFVLAQETPILLLDEPTTYLDIAHQIELLELLAELNREGRTVVAVLHDLNHASPICFTSGGHAKRGDHGGRRPSEIVTEKLIEDVFGLASVIITDPVSGTPLVVPPRNAPAISVTFQSMASPLPPSTILPPVA
ncbi:ABC transporter ATP-binding protein [Ochrobactrum intermedium]|nr:ABC transporter ATP-binding protein [Brucella intermedia]